MPGKRLTSLEIDKQQPLFIATADLPREVSHPFHAKLNEVPADYDLISRKTVGVDATTLEANAAIRSIVYKDTRKNYQEFLTGPAKASGIETPTLAEMSIRSYVSEPDRGQRVREDKAPRFNKTVYTNFRRVKGVRGKR